MFFLYVCTITENYRFTESAKAKYENENIDLGVKCQYLAWQ